ncbi:MAG: hypothetical protein HY079_09050 [Elusimicrobia bacterium]|nr:hypothetical protein [Elusimicrobiota bacterium]
MTKKSMTVLALALTASAAFGQTVAAVPAVHAKKTAMSAPVDRGPEKLLRGEILRDKNDLAAKRKAERAAIAELNGAMKAELAKVRSGKGTRAEKSAARKAVRAKYAGLMKDARAKSAFERKNLREDIVSKKSRIKGLRRS